MDDLEWPFCRAVLCEQRMVLPAWVAVFVAVTHCGIQVREINPQKTYVLTV